MRPRIWGRGVAESCVSRSPRGARFFSARAEDADAAGSRQERDLPLSEKGDGRDHNPTGFSMWFAGGGVRGGQTIGSTDELGLRAVEDRLHVHDLHATILWLLGLDNMGLVYPYKGRPERPTLNEGEPFEGIAH